MLRTHAEGLNDCSMKGNLKTTGIAESGVESLHYHTGTPRLAQLFKTNDLQLTFPSATQYSPLDWRCAAHTAKPRQGRLVSRGGRPRFAIDDITSEAEYGLHRETRHKHSVHESPAATSYLAKF